MEQLKCLICGLQNCDQAQLKDNCNEDSLISKHLQVIFLLRNILEIPSSKLVIFLRSHPNLEKWLLICSNCTQLVNHCKTTYHQILTAQKNFRTVKQQVIQVLKDSALIKQEISHQDDLNNYQLQDKPIDIVEQIRGYVYQNEYPMNVDPFISGDHLAYQQLSQIVDKTLEQLENEDDNHSDDNGWTNDDLQDNQDDDWIPSDNEQADISIRPSTSSRSTVRKPRKPLSTLSKMKKYKRGTFPCPHCSKTFPYKIYLNKHIKLIHDQRLSVTCPTCDSQFLSQGTLLKHQSKCTGTSIPCPKPNCPRKFGNPHALTRHLRDTHNFSKTQDPQRNCKFCGKYIPKPSDLQKHIRALHEQSDLFKCDLCDVGRSSKGDLENHRKICNGTSLPCPQPNCLVKCSTPLTLTHHVKTTHQDNLNDLLPFNCSECKPIKYYTSSELLNKHKKKNHKRSFAAANAAQNKIPPDGIPCPEPNCPQKLKSQLALKQHLRNWHDPKVIEEMRNRRTCKFCGKSYTKPSDLQKHIRAIHEYSDLYKCDLCGVGRCSETDLKRHRKHCKGESLACPAAGCGVKVNSTISLNHHVSGTHGDNLDDLLPFKCEKCGGGGGDEKRFLDFKSLRTHMLWKHKRKRGEGGGDGDEGKKEDERGPWICETCGGSYPTRRSLANHRRINNTCRGLRGVEKRGAEVICDICGGKFKNKGVLGMHKKVVHERRFTMNCDICGKGLNGMARLEIHLWQRHKVGDGEKWRCGVEGCEVKLYGRRQREDHARKHRGEEPGYKCEQCGKGFYMWTNIRQHVKEVHEGKRGKRGRGMASGGKGVKEEEEIGGDETSNDS